MDEVWFVKEPVAFQREGGNVRIEVKSGGRLFVFETPFSNFVANFANAAVVIHAAREPQCEVFDLEAVRGGH